MAPELLIDRNELPLHNMGAFAAVIVPVFKKGENEFAEIVNNAAVLPLIPVMAIFPGEVLLKVRPLPLITNAEFAVAVGIILIAPVFVKVVLLACTVKADAFWALMVPLLLNAP